MSPVLVGALGFFVLLLLIATRMPIGLAMLLSGLFGLAYLRGWNIALYSLGMVPWNTAYKQTMSVIPLFLLMGNICFYAGISSALYFAANKWFGSMRGGLAIATTAASAGFAAVSGSSVASAVTIGSVALPEMKKYHYDVRLATGSVAAGGTLGPMIPPSMGFIIYSMLTGVSVGELFIAGILPGLLQTGLFILTIYLLCLHDPAMGPSAPSSSFREKVVSLKKVWGVLIISLSVIGGIYFGIFTPTEAAAVGAFASFIIMIALRQFTRQNLLGAFLETARTTAMCFFILAGAHMFSLFLTTSTLPHWLSNIIAGLPIHRIWILVLIMLIYMFLGCIMDAMALTIVTIPIFFPVILALGFDPVWFGVLNAIKGEAAVITPPIGINVFVVAGVAKERIETVFAGIWPFFLAILVALALNIAFPQISLFLPKIMR